MRDYWIIWHYVSNYCDEPIRVQAHDENDAAERIYELYSDEFREKAELFVFDTEPTSIWQYGERVS